MKWPTVYIIGIILTIGLGGVLQYYYCCEYSMAHENVAVIPQSDGLPFEVIDANNDFNISVDDNFNFHFSSYEFITPLSNGLEDGLTTLRSFLTEHPETTLRIVGLGYEAEVNHSAFPTLGEARANAVKSAMVERGMASNQLIVEGIVLSETWTGSDSLVIGPVSYNLQHSEIVMETMVNNESPDLENVSTANFSEFVLNLKENPMVLYFETGSAFVHLSGSERDVISRLNQFIDQNADARIMIHGHTDNSGSPAINQRLALERAEFLKAYLVRNGFRADRIETISHGETTPVASNQTHEGMAQNRRAVLTVEN